MRCCDITVSETESLHVLRRTALIVQYKHTDKHTEFGFLTNVTHLRDMILILTGNIILMPAQFALILSERSVTEPIKIQDVPRSAIKGVISRENEKLLHSL